MHRLESVQLSLAQTYDENSQYELRDTQNKYNL